jgi:hypothetical protein
LPFIKSENKQNKLKTSKEKRKYRAQQSTDITDGQPDNDPTLSDNKAGQAVENQKYRATKGPKEPAPGAAPEQYR